MNNVNKYDLTRYVTRDNSETTCNEAGQKKVNNMPKTLKQDAEEELSTAETQAVIKLLSEKYQQAMQEELKVREEANQALAILRRAERKTKAAAQAWAEKHQFLFRFPKDAKVLTEAEQDELQNALAQQHHD